MERKLTLIIALLLSTSLADARFAHNRPRKTPACTPGSTLITTAGAGTFTVPANCKSVRIEIWGAGGMGGQAYDSGFMSGGGDSGQAGGYAMKLKSVNPGDVISYNVGLQNYNSDGDGGPTTADGMTANGGAYAPCPPGYTCGPPGGANGQSSGGAVNITGPGSNTDPAIEIGNCSVNHPGSAAPAAPFGGAGGLGGAGNLGKQGKPGTAPGGAGGGGGLDCFNAIWGQGGSGANGGIRITY